NLFIFFTRISVFDRELSNMRQLQTFLFDIVMINEESCPSPNDIPCIFIQTGYLVNCYIDDSPNEVIRCNVYNHSHAPGIR
ncbi:unnamed protein product, partial [Rotaria magnacalcarata]